MGKDARRRGFGCNRRKKNPRPPGVPLRLPARQGLQQQARELGSLAGFFVLEVDEHLTAGGGACADDPCPALKVIGCVALIAQPEIGVTCGDLEGRGKLLTVGDTQRQIVRLEPREHLRVHPGGVAELERGASARRQQRQKFIQGGEVLAQVGRQLKEDRAELRSERSRGLQEILRQVCAVLEPGDVRDALGRFERQFEILRSLALPAGENFLVRRAIKSVVDLDRGQRLRVVRQHLRRRELLRVEAAFPLRVVITGGSNPDGRHGRRPCQRPSLATSRRYWPRCRMACCDLPSDSYKRARLKWQSARSGSSASAPWYASSAARVSPMSSSSTPWLKSKSGSGPSCCKARRYTSAASPVLPSACSRRPQLIQAPGLSGACSAARRYADSASAGLVSSRSRACENQSPAGAACGAEGGGAGTCVSASRSTTCNTPFSSDTSRPSRYCPLSTWRCAAPSRTTTWSPTALMDRPESGMDSGRSRRRLSSERRMRRCGIFASMSARAVRSTIRSWNEKRYSRRGPRAGCTNPARINLRVVSGASRRTRSTSRTLYERIVLV